MARSEPAIFVAALIGVALLLWRWRLVLTLRLAAKQLRWQTDVAIRLTRRLRGLRLIAIIKALLGRLVILLVGLGLIHADIAARNQVLRWAGRNILAIEIVVIALVVIALAILTVLAILPVVSALIGAIETAMLVLIGVLILLPFEAGIDHTVIMIGVLKIILCQHSVPLRGRIATQRQELVQELLRIPAHTSGVVIKVIVPTPAATLVVHAWFAAVAAALTTLHGDMLFSLPCNLHSITPPVRPKNHALWHRAARMLRRGVQLSGVR
jgi:hypothetical protein